MTATTIRPFPFDVRPRHRESVESYTSRLLRANFCTDEHRSTLLRQLPATTKVGDTQTGWMTVLGAKTKRATLHLTPHPSAWLQHADGSSCDACAEGLGVRTMCTLCAHGAVIGQNPHFDDLVCTRHRRWVGLGSADAQRQVPQSVVDAADLFDRLRRQHRIDLRLYTMLTAALQRENGLDAADSPEAFEAATRLAAVITRVEFAVAFYDPARAYRAAHQLLSQAVNECLGYESAGMVRAIWLYARPTFWAIRHAIITGQPYQPAWVHDLAVPVTVLNGFDLTVQPAEPFSEYLAVTGDTQLTLAQYGLTAPTRTGLRRTKVDGQKKVLTICAAGHQIVATPPSLKDLREGQAPKCQVCRARVVVPGYNDLQTTHPHLAAEFDPELNADFTPQNITASSPRAFFWRCPKGHPYEMQVSGRTHLDGGCPVCSNRRIVAGINDVATTDPHVIDEWHPDAFAKWPPTRYSSGSKTLIPWLCAAGHTYYLQIWQRTSGKGCPECDRLATRSSRDNLAITHPELAAQWHPTRNEEKSPEDFTAGSKQEVFWICAIGHEYRQRIERRAAGYKCSVCSRRTLVPNVNDLATTEPVLVREWHPYLNHKQPNQIFAGTDKYWWLCANKHKYQQSVPHRVKSKGCPECEPDQRVLALSAAPQRAARASQSSARDRSGQ